MPYCIKDVQSLKAHKRKYAIMMVLFLKEKKKLL